MLPGAYWRGDEKRKQLVRLYGITFPKKKMLDEYLALMEEAKKRDHRKIGKELELFTFSTAVGAGLPLWLPRGTQLRLKLEDFLKRIQKKYGYQQVMSSAYRWQAVVCELPATTLNTVRIRSSRSILRRRVKSSC